MKIALWNLGFRPFYLLAGIFAALDVPLWALQYAGALPAGVVRSPAWHAHEMLFGFALAVVTGFLFTAVRNWTGRATPHGPLLAAYAALWIAGRVLVFTPWLVAGAVVNAAFAVAVAAGIGVPLVRSGNRRNYFFVALLLALGGATLAVHLAQMQWLQWPPSLGLRLGLDIVLFVMAVMGGRVIPMFTSNGIPGVDARRHAALERVALGGILALLAADLLQLPDTLLAVLALVAAIAHALRLALWRPWKTGAVPLVWILHAAYAWIVVHLLLRAAASLGAVAESLAVHALTVGAIGGMTIGMMTRTARGHTGRPLVADGFERAAFVLVQGAAALRVFGGLLLPSEYLATVIAAACCWSGAFALYAVRYWPILLRPRLDGKPG